MKLIPPETRKEIEDLTLRLAREHLPSSVSPKIRWTNSRSYLGEAFCSFLCLSDPKISYSRYLGLTTSESRIETVYHEITHLIVFYSIAQKFPIHETWAELEREGDHGPLFYSRMREFGYPNPKGC